MDTKVIEQIIRQGGWEWRRHRGSSAAKKLRKMGVEHVQRW